MKKIIVSIAVCLFLGAHTIRAQQKEFKETIRKEMVLDSDSKKLVVKNIFGAITIEGYEGNRVNVEVEKRISADNTSDLELGKKELRLKMIQENGQMFIHPDAPYLQFTNGKLKSNWCNDYEEPVYRHHLNFTIKVPNGLKLELSTVNNGEILVQNMRGSFVKANNVNGGIVLENITGQTKVHAINGEVKVSYTNNPQEGSTYYSLNGDITITYQKNLSAEIGFKSMNGELFTDFDIVDQYAKTSKEKPEDSKKGKFKYESKPIVKIGGGRLFHDFETLNGNVIIKKI